MAISVGINVAIIQPFVQKKFSSQGMVIFSISFLSFLFIMLLPLKWLNDFSYIKSIALLWILSGAIYILFGLLDTSFTSIFSSLVEKSNQGKLMGLVGQVKMFSWFVSGFLVAFLVLAHWSLLLLCSSVFSLISLLSYIYHYHNNKNIYE